MPDPYENPTVSVVLYAYEEQRFIGEAVASILAQDYSPLEIVLSDDGSKDRTFDIMQEMAASYPGPHQIFLNRNETNIGIGAQINRGVAMTTGRLVMLANGDDVYPPHRVSRLVEVWRQQSHPKAIWTDIEQIDAAGRKLGIVMNLGRCFQSLEAGILARFGGPGATCSIFDREVFTAFGPIPDNMLLEDNPLFARGYLLGNTYFLDEPLVQYRVHDENISQVYHTGDFASWRARRKARAVWHAREGCRAFVEMLRDMYQAPARNWPQPDLGRARWAAVEKIYETAALADFHADDNPLSEGARWLLLARLARLQLKLSIKRLIPWIERRNENWEFRQYRKAP